ncbi:MAG: ABC transporter substrate-binding (seleno)protein SaoB [Pseudomonadota bacterium]
MHLQVWNSIRRHFSAQSLLALLLCLSLVGCSDKDSSHHNEKTATLHLGAGPGLPMMFAEAFIQQLQAEDFGLEIQNAQGSLANIMASIPLDVRTVADCCSAVSQWALASRELDMSIMCPVAAASLVADNEDYVLAGPVVLGGDILVRRLQDVHTGIPAQKVGIAHLRVPQRELVNASLPESEVTELLPGALPYALERGVVDGIVVDALLARQNPMVLCQTIPPKSQYLQASQVLVIHRRLYENPHYAKLVMAMQRAAAQCNAALGEMATLQACQITEEDAVFTEEEQPWTKTLTKFVSPLDFP